MSDAPNYIAMLADIDARIAALQGARQSLVAFILSQGWHNLDPQNSQNSLQQPSQNPHKH